MFVCSTGLASAWLEYSVESQSMTPSMTPLFLTFSFQVSTISQSSPSIILFACLVWSCLEQLFIIMPAGFYLLLIYLKPLLFFQPCPSEKCGIYQYVWHVCLFFSNNVSPLFYSWENKTFCISNSFLVTCSETSLLVHMTIVLCVQPLYWLVWFSSESLMK